MDTTEFLRAHEWSAWSCGEDDEVAAFELSPTVRAGLGKYVHAIARNTKSAKMFADALQALRWAVAAPHIAEEIALSLSGKKMPANYADNLFNIIMAAVELESPWDEDDENAEDSGLPF